jgi:hypothetical protein
MQLKQQKLGNLGLSHTLFSSLKLWTVIAIISISILLSSCGSKVSDYKTSLGDPSLYKELYSKGAKEYESLRRKLDNANKEVSRMKEKYADLRASKEGNIVLLEREQELDLRERNLYEREEKLKQEQEKIDNATSEIFGRSIEIGKNIGQLEKDEEMIENLLREVRNKNTQVGTLILTTIILVIFIIFLLLYMFLYSYGILGARSRFVPRPIVDISEVDDKDKFLEPKSSEKLLSETSESQDNNEE